MLNIFLPLIINHVLQTLDILTHPSLIVLYKYFYYIFIVHIILKYQLKFKDQFRELFNIIRTVICFRNFIILL